MNAIILKGAALCQPPLPQSGPEPKQLHTPALADAHFPWLFLVVRRTDRHEVTTTRHL
jgi:hypothetical protein